MFSYLRRRFGIPGVISVIALVFALTGSAFAAKYVITSKGQIKPSVLKSLTGKPGATGATGAQGPKGDTGAAGQQGAAGKDGAVGPQGPAGPNGAAGQQGPIGPEGSPWTAGGTLPELATETGTWGGIHEGEGFLVTPVSFALPVVPAPELVFVGTEGTKPGCGGVIDGVPTASEGKLCVYASTLAGAVQAVNFDPTGAPEAAGTGTTGTLLGFECAGTCQAYGSYAVTAAEG
jgi:hypothetical protein